MEHRGDVRRIVGATLLAAVVWTFFLSHARWLFSGSELTVHPNPPLDVRLAQWPQPQPEKNAVNSGANEQPKDARGSHAGPRKHDFVRRPQPTREPRLPTSPRALETAQQTKPISTDRTPATPADAVQARTGSSAAPSPSAPQSATVRPESTEIGSARIVSQPIPELPDDLREDGYRFVAIAHFTIHADGTFDVELVKPTPNPRLNQILMTTLHAWRFIPATEAGHPVESHQDVRVHFNVD